MKKIIKPQTLKGFRDFLPEEKKKRDWLIKKITSVFERFGFEPIETPTLEYASLLLGKYGTEADKLIYTFKDKGRREVALRYDQTVPTARVLTNNQNPDVLPKILRRYQIQNVFRAEKPQRGRYREFTQCDADIFGTLDPIADAEILTLFYKIYTHLGIKSLKIKINDRILLFNTIFNIPNISQTQAYSIIQSLDKLDKKKKSEVLDELVKKGFNRNNCEKLVDSLSKSKPPNSLQEIIDLTVSLGVPKDNLIFNPFLARGLDYYTGLIFEGIIPEYAVGSIGGGGRYNNLIKQLCNINIAAVGFGIGFDRTLEAIEQLNLIPKTVLSPTTKVLVTIFKETLSSSLEITNKLRQLNINTEVFTDSSAKLGKQLKYADKKGIPYAVILEPDEIKKGIIKLKDLTKDPKEENEKDVEIEKLIEMLKK